MTHIYYLYNWGALIEQKFQIIEGYMLQTTCLIASSLQYVQIMKCN